MYRKIALLAAAVGLVMINGCAEIDRMQVDVDQFRMKARVHDNVFSSSSPRLELKMDDDLRLMATLEEEKVTAKNSIEKDRLENTVKYFSYLFGDTGDGDAVTRGVVIRTRTVIGNPNQPVDAMPPDPRNELVSGLTKILGDEYGSYATVSENLFTRSEQLDLSGKNLEGCFMVKGLERDFGLGGKSFIQILYFERMDGDDGALQCGSWQNPQGLTGEQEQLLEAFLGRSYEGVRFVKAQEVVDSSSRYVDQDKSKDAVVETPPPPAPAPPAGDIEKRLETLKNLRDRDLITREDYERKKAEILQGL